MINPIEAIFFDVNGTLRKTIKRDTAEKMEWIRQILVLLGSGNTPQEFEQLLSSRAQTYQCWAKETLIGLSEEKIWTQWLLPEWPPEQIQKLASQLNRLWKLSRGTREIFPETMEVLIQLFRRGYRLGVISNTTSSSEIPQFLAQMNLSGCVEPVLLSCVFGKRKPDPSMHIAAAASVGIPPDRCAYVGNRPMYDVAASRQAGFATSIILHDPKEAQPQLTDPTLVPDRYITNLYELLDIFPPHQPVEEHFQPGDNGKSKSHEAPIWDVSISSMWAIKNFPSLEDFFLAAPRYGFSRIELNHQVNSTMLAGIENDHYQFSSIHEPCPADISTEELTARDWLISATDEDCRRQGVAATRRSIDLAHELGAGVVVVHAGNVRLDTSIEKKLRVLVVSRQAESQEYEDLKNRLINSRAALIESRFEAVKKSLKELLDYANRFGVRLGLENRYHYRDIPLLDEMGVLLELAGSDQFGFVYDVGHAQSLERLGFFPHEEWLRRYASRIIVTHLHDVIGVDDHLAPGLGEVDFDRVAPYLPDNAIRVCEMKVSTTPTQVKAGVRFLAKKGCIRNI
jgi:FMN phosphatase YigB (HAD superfamily)/sugar phosphate isomerase/epimerase